MHHTIFNRIFVRIKIQIMKVTAIIDDALIKEAIRYSNAKSTTEAVKIALQEYIALKRLRELGNQIKTKPLKFNHSADEIRSLNRQ